MHRRIHSALRVRAAEFDTDRVGPGGGLILMTLADTEPSPIQETVRRLSRDKSQMTRAIRSLERKGLIERRQASEDARVCLLSLTGDGHATVKRIQLALAEVIDEILAPLKTREKKQLKEFLQRVALGRQDSSS